MRYACRTGYHQRCPGAGTAAATPAAAGMDPLSTTNAPSRRGSRGPGLGRQVAMHRGYQSVLFDDPADYA